jgi:hypothetical protein
MIIGGIGAAAFADGACYRVDAACLHAIWIGKTPPIFFGSFWFLDFILTARPNIWLRQPSGLLNRMCGACFRRDGQTVSVDAGGDGVAEMSASELFKALQLLLEMKRTSNSLTCQPNGEAFVVEEGDCPVFEMGVHTCVGSDGLHLGECT